MAISRVRLSGSVRRRLAFGRALRVLFAPHARRRVCTLSAASQAAVPAPVAGRTGEVGPAPSGATSPPPSPLVDADLHQRVQGGGINVSNYLQFPSSFFSTLIVVAFMVLMEWTMRARCTSDIERLARFSWASSQALAIFCAAMCDSTRLNL
jgi:hypothetical protein